MTDFNPWKSKFRIPIPSPASWRENIGADWDLTSTRNKSMLRLVAAIVLVLFTVSNAWSFGLESFGNDPLSAANFADWPNVTPVVNDAHRVYHSWVNGNEDFYFVGDSVALNAALKNFAAVKADRLTIVLRPGPGSGNSFNNKKSFTFNWNLHLLGGISRMMAKEELGSNIWDPTGSVEKLHM
jgi:hypothetical protein